MFLMKMFEMFDPVISLVGSLPGGVCRARFLPEHLLIFIHFISKQSLEGKTDGQTDMQTTSQTSTLLNEIY